MAWHYLKPNASNALPRRLVFFNVAYSKTDHSGPDHSSRLNFQSLHALSGRLEDFRLTRQQRLDCVIPEMFWPWVFSQMGPRDTTWIIGHNVITDCVLSGLLPIWESGLITLDLPRAKRRENDTNVDHPHSQGFCCIQDPPTIIGLRHTKTNARFVILDILNYYADTIKTIGERFNLPHLQQANESNNVEASIERCQRNVEILAVSFIHLLRFVRDSDYGMFRYTAAAQSIAAYRHRFMKHQICLHDDLQLKHFERESFYGGQISIFRRGVHKDSVHQYDVCSLYPSVMRCSLYPTKLRDCCRNWPNSTLKPPIQLSHSIARVKLNTIYESFPTRQSGHTQYATGQFETCLSGPELDYAYRNNLITNWGMWAEYYCEPIFTLFVDTLWAQRLSLRLSGDRVGENIVKLMLNTLYGKFAQKSTEWIIIQDQIPPEPFVQWTEIDTATGKRTSYRSIGWNVQMEVEREELTRSFPAISAFVTAYGRQRMRELRHKAGMENVYYQGVDSLIVNDQGKENLEKAGEIAQFVLGRLRHQYSANECNLIAASCYTIGSKTVAAGMKDDATILSDSEWIEEQICGVKRLFSGGETTYIDTQVVRKEFRKWIEKESTVTESLTAIPQGDNTFGSVI